MLEFLDYPKLLGGFIFLLMGGELLVRGSLGLARESRIPPVVVGMTVVAFGTSAPELMVSIISALSGHPGIAIGNVVGSNIANILLVLGVPVLIYPIICDQKGLTKQASLMIGMTILFIGLCVFEPITMIDGIFLLLILFGFLFLTSRGAVVIPGLDDPEEELSGEFRLPTYPLTITLMILLGIIMLPLGANLVVEGGAGLARTWNVPDRVIGLSLIALGTSLPELSTTVMAALYRSSDVAIGNVIGSNLFNILAVLGVTAIVTDIPVDPTFIEFDLWIMLGTSFILWVFVFLKLTINKPIGVLFLLGYVTYIFAIY